MADDDSAKIIKNNPIGNNLNPFRCMYKSVCERLELDPSTIPLGQMGIEDVQRLVSKLIVALCMLRATSLLPSSAHHDNLGEDLIVVTRRIRSHPLDSKFIIPLMKAVVNNASDDAIVAETYTFINEFTPHVWSVSSFLQMQPMFFTTSVTSWNHYRNDVDDLVRREFRAFHLDVSGFYDAFFGGIPRLEEVSLSIFENCREDDQVFNERFGWSDWPLNVTEDNILKWFAEKTNFLVDAAKTLGLIPQGSRRLAAKPDKFLDVGSVAKCRMDIGFIDDSNPADLYTCQWSQVLVPGQVKCMCSQDTIPETWTDLARYVRKMLLTQDRRFSLAFTLCGPIMRVWEFDRVGGIASKSFDINKDGQQFISTVLGFLCMNKVQLGFDPTIVVESPGKAYMEITRNGEKERLILDYRLRSPHCITGRGTICWKAHPEKDESKVLVIKDSWQLPEHAEEGEMLKKATQSKAINVARYYHHEIVHVDGHADDVQQNIRKGLDVDIAPIYNITKPDIKQGRNAQLVTTISALLQNRKRKYVSSSNKDLLGLEEIPNRKHCRVVVQDYGKPIYTASTPAALLAAFSNCIEGYKSLLSEAKILHQDISIGNLLINEQETNSSWPAFLIDLDFAIKDEPRSSYGPPDLIGTKIFMGIRALRGEQHSYMHDYESFFWVLYWICVHYGGPRKIKPRKSNLEEWKTMTPRSLAVAKKCAIHSERSFSDTATFTDYYKPLFPCVEELRRIVFLDGHARSGYDPVMAEDMIKILRKGQEDLEKSMTKASDGQDSVTGN